MQKSFNLKPWKLHQFAGSKSLACDIHSYELDDVPVFSLCINVTIFMCLQALFVGWVIGEQEFSLKNAVTSFLKRSILHWGVFPSGHNYRVPVSRSLI